jgi:putative transposase
MPRKPRDVDEGIHHVWVNATGNAPYFEDELDRLTWVRYLVRALNVHSARCIALCQMTTHVHALLKVGSGVLPAFMRDLNREYAKEFNSRHERAGVLDRKRYGSRNVSSDSDLLWAYAYVVLNPVRAAKCQRAEDWRWSSYATTVGIESAFPFVDGTVVCAVAGGQRALRDFIESTAADVIRSNGHDRYQVPAVSG